MTHQADRTSGARSHLSFTIATPGSAGIADTLVNHFALLHDLGLACGLEYAHSPLNFARSVTAARLRARRWLAIQAYLHFGTLIPFRSRLRTAHRLWQTATSKAECPVATLLGLHDIAPPIHDPTIFRRPAVDVDIAGLCRTRKPRSLDEVRRVLHEHASAGDTPVLLRFHPGAGYHHELGRLRQMIDHADPNRRETTQRFLHDRYWTHRKRSRRMPPSPKEIRVVLHIRRGDRAIVELPGRKLTLHGDRVYEDEVAHRNEIVRIEPDFRHTPPRHYVETLSEVSTALGGKSASLTVLSDGHERTLFALIDAVSRNLVQLSRTDRAHLRRLAAQWRGELQSLPWQGPVNRIIGESVSDTLRSIDALATADVVIHDAGGFSRVVHRLYRPRSDTLILDSRHFNTADKTRLEEWIERRRDPAARAASRPASLTASTR